LHAKIRTSRGIRWKPATLANNIFSRNYIVNMSLNNKYLINIIGTLYTFNANNKN